MSKPVEMAAGRNCLQRSLTLPYRTSEESFKMMRSSEEFLASTNQRPSLVAMFWHSTVGKKVVMAVTGAIGFGYLIAHMTGNLLVFRGAAKIDAYAAFLKSNLGLLWAARAILLVAVIAHIVAAFQLARISQKSRPI